MKKKHYIITAVLAYFILLVATIPARIITSAVNNNTPVTIQGVSGTLWNAKAQLINIDELITLENTQLSLSFWQVFTGKIAINTITHYSGQKINTRLGTSFLGRLFINDLNAKISATDVTELANIPLAQLGGVISINIEHAEWKQGELPLATGEISWNNATVTVAEAASLGNVLIILGESDQQQLKADISNQGGDIKINGTANLIPTENYAVDIKLKPTSSANNNIKQSLGMVAKKQKNGEYVLQYSGSLSQIGI